MALFHEIGHRIEQKGLLSPVTSNAPDPPSVLSFARLFSSAAASNNSTTSRTISARSIVRNAAGPKSGGFNLRNAR